MRKIFCGLLIAFSALHADSVLLTDGSKIEGRVESIKHDQVIFTNSLIGEITIPLTQIASLESDVSLSLKTKNGEVANGSISVKNGAISLTSNSNSKTISTEELSYTWPAGSEDPAIEAAQPKWSGEVGLNINGKTGNRDSFASGLHIKAERRTASDILSLGASYETAEVEDEKSKDRTLAKASYENFFTEILGWYARQEFEKDPIRDLSFRSSSTAGLSYRAINTDSWDLRFRSGIGYQVQDFSSADTESGLIADLGLDHTYTFKNSIVWKTTLSLIPEVEDLGRFTLYHNTSLDIPTSFAFSLRLGIGHTYQSEPAGDTKELDTTYFTSLIYKF